MLARATSSDEYSCSLKMKSPKCLGSGHLVCVDLRGHGVRVSVGVPGQAPCAGSSSDNHAF